MDAQTVDDVFDRDDAVIDDFAYRSSRQLGVRNEPLVPTWAIDELPRFHFFATWAGQTLKAELPLLGDPEKTVSTQLKEGPPENTKEVIPPPAPAEVEEAKSV